MSEFALAGIGIRAVPVLAALVLIALTLAAIGMVRSLFAMLYGKASEDDRPIAKERWQGTHMAIVLHLASAVILGVLLIMNAPWVVSVLSRVAATITTP